MLQDHKVEQVLLDLLALKALWVQLVLQAQREAPGHRDHKVLLDPRDPTVPRVPQEEQVQPAQLALQELQVLQVLKDPQDPKAHRGQTDPQDL